MPKNFFNPDNLGGDCLALENDLRLGTPTAVFGVSDAYKALLAATCAPGRVVYITDTAPNAARMAAEIGAFAGEDVALLCAKDEVLLYKEAVSKDALFRRLTALRKVRKGTRLVVADVESLLQIFPDDVPAVVLREGEEMDFTALPRLLVGLGYSRVSEVESPGMFALRGDILDIFPVGAENPVRVDFFGDTVEKIKPYNFVTGERLPLVSSVEFPAATDVRIDADEIGKVKDALFGELSSFRDVAAYERAQTIAGELSARLDGGEAFAGAAYLLPLLRHKTDFCTFFGDCVYKIGRAHV